MCDARLLIRKRFKSRCRQLQISNSAIWALFSRYLTAIWSYLGRVATLPQRSAAQGPGSNVRTLLEQLG